MPVYDPFNSLSTVLYLSWPRQHLWDFIDITVTGVHSLAGELALRWNQIEASLFSAFEKLKKLGYIYINGEVSILASKEEDKHV